MRKLFCLALILAVVGIASATNLLTNPGFEYADGSAYGWTAWNAVDEGAWGDDKSRDLAISEDAASGEYSLLLNANTASGFSQQFGIYQIVDVPVGTEVQLTGMWKGDLGGNGWAEIKMATCAAGIEYPNLNLDATKFYVAKIDTYDYDNGNPTNTRPDGAWNWEDIGLAEGGLGNTIVSEGQVIVYTQLGGWGSESVMQLDCMSLEVVPEPTTIALLGFGVLGLIRRKK